MKRLLCFIFGHNLRVLKAFSFKSRCVMCRRCRYIWAMNDENRALLPWNGEFAELYKWSPFKYDEELNSKT